MKLQFILVSLLLGSILTTAYAQLSTSEAEQFMIDNAEPGYANWDWEDTQNKDWYARTSGSISADNAIDILDNPLLEGGVPSNIRRVRDSKDYTKSRGWVCLKRDFGYSSAEDTPYFILYNKYSGMVRLFIYLDIGGSQWASGYAISMQFADGNGNSLLFSTGDDLAYASEEYLDSNNDLGDDIVYYRSDNLTQKGWIMGEFMTNLDIHTDQGNYDYVKIHFALRTVATSVIELSIEGESVTKDYLLRGKQDDIEGEPDEGSDSFKEIDAALAKVTKITDKAEEIRADINKQSVELYDKVSDFQNDRLSNLSGTPEEIENKKERILNQAYGVTGIIRSLHNFTTDDSKLSKVLSGISEGSAIASTILTGVSTIVGFFAKDEDVATQPNYVKAVYSTFDLTATGTMEIEAPMLDIYVALPGIDMSNVTLFEEQPFYNCTLGVVNLRNTPIIDEVYYDQEYIRKREESHRVTVNNDTEGIYDNRFSNEWTTPAGLNVNWPSSVTSYAQFANDNLKDENYRLYKEYKSIKVTNDLIVDINGSLDFDEKSIKVALIAEVDKRDVLTDNQEWLFPRTGNFTGISDLRIQKINTLLADVENGKINIYGSNPVDDKLIIGTPYVDVEDFKGHILNVPRNAKIYVKVITGLYSDDDLIPDFYLAKGYHIDVVHKTQSEIGYNEVQDIYELPPFYYSSETFPDSKVEMFEEIKDVNLPEDMVVNGYIATDNSIGGGGSWTYQSFDLNDQTEHFNNTGEYIKSDKEISLNNVKISAFDYKYPSALVNRITTGWKGGTPGNVTHLNNSFSGLGYSSIHDMKTPDVLKPVIIISANSITLEEGVEVIEGAELELTIADSKMPTLGTGELSIYSNINCDPENSNAVVSRNAASKNKEVISQNGLRLFPNPSSEMVTIQNDLDEVSNVSVYDIRGIEIFHSSLKGTMNLDVRNYNTGTYIIRIRNSRGVFNQKLMVE
ncbi:T9SS type A sorting domain-containing protein [Aquimarina pacifica]|uniref:T9SS type A sorting domain-containing protein n=1 Tax=Aquimarina pacifica TaxID=1296415 RepID=UPI000472AD28|nr:T9SS type A sorting domain-containing protein [Aquimarina pacifica]